MKPRQLVVLSLEIGRNTEVTDPFGINVSKKITVVLITMGVRGVNGLPDVPSHVLRMYPDHRGISEEPITPTESARES